MRGHSASIRVGKPNQTLHTEHTQATGQGVTSQALATAEVRKKSLVREAILKFSVKVKNHPPDLQKVHGDPPKVKLSPEPQKRANPKSTPNLQKVNFDPPKVNPFFLLKRVGPKTLQSVNMPEPNPQFSSKGEGGKPTEPLKTKPVDTKTKTRNQTIHTPPQNKTIKTKKTSETKPRKKTYTILKNQQTITGMLKKTNDTPKPELKPNQEGGTKPVEVKPVEPGDNNTLKKHENQTKVTLKPPTLLYIEKPQLTSTQLSGKEENQDQTVTNELETNKNQIKPKQEIEVTKPNQKRPPNLTNQAMPVKKPTKPVKTQNQRGKPTLKPVKTHDIRLYLENKRKEREQKQNQQIFEDTLNCFDVIPSPSTSSTSATLVQTSISLSQSATRASSPVRTEKLSSTIQGEISSSASNLG